MEININNASIESAVREIGKLNKTTQEVVHSAHQATLNGSFSGVSGLNQLGSGHGAVLNGGPGSAMSVLESYAEQVSWLHDALIASHAAVTGQNMFAARGLDIADEGGSVGADSVSFPQRPAPRFENFSFTPPVVTPALSIDQLANDFSTTNIGVTAAAGIAWETMSTGIAAVAAGLNSVAGQLASSNSGEVIEAAVQKISEVAGAGDTFAANSAVMAKSVQQLAAIKSHGNFQVVTARTALAAIPDPIQRKAAEQAFLVSFPATFTPSVVTGVPPIRNLMSMDGSVDGGGQIALGMTDVDGDGPAEVEGLNPAGAGAASSVLNAMRSVTTAGQFGAVESGLGELAAVGSNAAEFDALAEANSLGTTSAGLGTPLPANSGSPAIGSLGMGPINSPAGAGGLGIGGPGMPLGSIGGIRGGGSGQLRTPGVTGVPGSLGTVGGGVGGVSTPGGHRAPGVMPAGGGMPGGSVGGMRAGAPVGGMGAPMMGGMGSGATGTTVGTAGSRGGGLPSAGGLAGRGGATAGVGGFAPGGIGGAGSAGGTGPRVAGVSGGYGAGAPVAGGAGDTSQSRSTAGGAAGAKSAGPGRTMMPMMGAPMAGAGGGQGKPSKVKTVTSAVEEDGNIAALLGERGPVVPGVIGAWARG